MEIRRILATKLLISSVVIACAVLLYFLLPAVVPYPTKILISIFVFAVFFWAFEIVELWVTSLVIVLLLTFFLTDLSSPEYKFFLLPFANPVIMLFFGGFMMAAALHKGGLDLFLIQKCMGLLGNRSYTLILGFLFISAFFSWWISNTAAAAMMLMLVRPILAKVEEDDPFRKALVLAVAFGANIGGIATPIGTPPNAIAIGILSEYGIHINFLKWMMVGVPLSLLVLAVAYLFITLFFKPQQRVIDFQIDKNLKMPKRGKWVLSLLLLAIVLWLTKPMHHIPEAVVALLVTALLAIFGFLKKGDLRKIHWEVLVLMWGGLALGEALKVTQVLNPLLDLPIVHEFDLLIVLLFGVGAIVLSSFISNTAAANLLLPIGIALGTMQKVEISIIIAFCCSFAMAFPVSTPPNAIAYSSEMISTKDMFKSGILISCFALIFTLAGFHYILPIVFS